MMKLTVLALFALVCMINCQPYRGGYGGGYGGGYDGGYGGGYGGDDNRGGNGLLLEFYRRNRIPYWAKVQNTPLGPRFFWRRDVHESKNVSDVVSCDYNRAKSLLRCNRSVSDFVECDAVEKLEKFRFGRFETFSIGAVPVGNLSAVNLLKYSLYPERPDKAGWKHSKIKDLLTHKTYEHSVYFSTNVTDNGFRVVDPVCWKKLVDLFVSVRVPEQVKLGMKPGRVDEVKIVGKLRTRV